MLHSVVKYVYNSIETKHEQTVRAVDYFHICVIVRNVVELYALEMELPVVQTILKKYNTGGTTNVMLYLRPMFSARQVRSTSCNEIVYKVSPREENMLFFFW